MLLLYVPNDDLSFSECQLTVYIFAIVMPGDFRGGHSLHKAIDQRIASLAHRLHQLRLPKWDFLCGSSRLFHWKLYLSWKGQEGLLFNKKGTLLDNLDIIFFECTPASPKLCPDLVFFYKRVYTHSWKGGRIWKRISVALCRCRC